MSERIRFKIEDCNDLEESLHVLTGLLSQSVVESVINESTEILLNNRNFNRLFSTKDSMNKLKRKWTSNLHMVY